MTLRDFFAHAAAFTIASACVAASIYIAISTPWYPYPSDFITLGLCVGGMAYIAIHESISKKNTSTLHSRNYNVSFEYPDNPHTAKPSPRAQHQTQRLISLHDSLNTQTPHTNATAPDLEAETPYSFIDAVKAALSSGIGSFNPTPILKEINTLKKQVSRSNGASLPRDMLEKIYYGILYLIKDENSDNIETIDRLTYHPCVNNFCREAHRNTEIKKTLEESGNKHAEFILTRRGIVDNAQFRSSAMQLRHGGGSSAFFNESRVSTANVRPHYLH